MIILFGGILGNHLLHPGVPKYLRRPHHSGDTLQGKQLRTMQLFQCGPQSDDTSPPCQI